MEFLKPFAVLVVTAGCFFSITHVVFADNSAPVLDASRTPVMTTITEDAGAPVGVVGTSVTSLVDSTTPAGGLDNVMDVDGGVLGIAIVANNTANLTCFYSINSGTSWLPIGSTSTSSARLLIADPNHRIYCQPAADYNGTIAAAITFRAWDQSTGTDGGTADTSASGGTTAFSTATDTANLTVGAVNDNPVAVDDEFTILENSGETIFNLINNDYDVDGDLLEISSFPSGLSHGVGGLGTGDITYTPDTDYCGDDVSTYLLLDSNGGSDTGNITIHITCADSTAPDTFLLSVTPEFMVSPIWGFLFESTEDPSTFECSLDNGAFAPCTSPYISPTLALGPHTFEVRAIDGASLVDATPATASWTVIPNYELESVSPADDAKGVSTNTSIVFRFADPVHSFLREHFTISSEPCDTSCPTLEATWSENNTVLTYTKTDGPFKQKTTYTFRLGNDHDGVIDEDVDYGSFTTRSNTSIGGHILEEEKTISAQGVSLLISEKYHFPRTLKFGLQGDDVVLLQKFLGITPPPSKHFGPLTKGILIKYQKARGLDADGIAGPKTLAAVESEMN